jgi:hypothetical protein
MGGAEDNTSPRPNLATQLGVILTEVGRGILSVPQRINLFTRLDRNFRRVAECAFRRQAMPEFTSGI